MNQNEYFLCREALPRRQVASQVGSGASVGRIGFFHEGCEAPGIPAQDQRLEELEVFFIHLQDSRHIPVSCEEPCVELGTGAEDLLKDRPLRSEDGGRKGVEGRLRNA